jgi:hypothetical protein
MTAPKNLIGQQFGQVTVLTRIENSAAGKTRWLCVCACGKRFPSVGASLIQGQTVSCGCHKTRLVRIRSRKHAMSGTPEYSAWQGMQARCYNPKNARFAYYGGRGITVCDRWRQSFQAFYEDIGPRPNAKYSLDRIDYDGPYAPGNVRWADWHTQRMNQRKHRPFHHGPTCKIPHHYACRGETPPTETTPYVFQGVTYTLAELADISGHSAATLSIIFRTAHTLEEALTTNFYHPNEPNPFIEHQGKIRTAIGWRKHLNISSALVCWRVKEHWTLERAVTMPPKSRRFTTP